MEHTIYVQAPSLTEQTQSASQCFEYVAQHKSLMNKQLNSCRWDLKSKENFKPEPPTDLVLCMSITRNNIVLYLPISIHLLGQSIRSSTFRLLLAESHRKLCNMDLWIRSSISKILSSNQKEIHTYAAENCTKQD